MRVNLVREKATKVITLKGNGFLGVFVIQIEHFSCSQYHLEIKETLIPIIKERIADGTTIISDCWKSYDCLSEEDFRHLTFNHSLNFVDPETGAHTQNIECLWWQIK